VQDEVLSKRAHNAVLHAHVCAGASEADVTKTPIACAGQKGDAGNGGRLNNRALCHAQTPTYPSCAPHTVSSTRGPPWPGACAGLAAVHVCAHTSTQINTRTRIHIKSTQRTIRAVQLVVAVGHEDHLDVAVAHQVSGVGPALVDLVHDFAGHAGVTQRLGRASCTHAQKHMRATITSREGVQKMPRVGPEDVAHARGVRAECCRQGGGEQV